MPNLATVWTYKSGIPISLRFVCFHVHPQHVFGSEENLANGTEEISDFLMNLRDIKNCPVTEYYFTNSKLHKLCGYN